MKVMAVKWASEYYACGSAIDWLNTLPSDSTMTYAWGRCKRSDWMLWALVKAGHNDKYEAVLRLFAVSCARRSLLAERKAGREPDPRCWDVLRVVTRYTKGKASDEELRSAESVAESAAASAVELAAESAAWSVASAASAESAAWSAASAARSAAWSVASAARSAAWSVASAASAESAAWSAASAESAARSAAWSLQADSLRRLIPEWPGENQSK